jgi:hypothetical protein
MFKNKKALRALAGKATYARNAEQRRLELKKTHDKMIEDKEYRTGGVSFVKNGIKKIIAYYENRDFESPKVNVSTFSGKQRAYICFCPDEFRNTPPIRIDVDGYLFYSENRKGESAQLRIKLIPLFLGHYEREGLSFFPFMINEPIHHVKFSEVYDLIEREVQYLENL